MSLSAILNDRPASGYRMLPEGSKLDPVHEHIELMRRHESMATYSLTKFASDLTMREGGRHLVTIPTLQLHLRSIRAGESKARSMYVSAERVREMILELPFTEEQIQMMDSGVVADLGLKAAVR